MITPLFSVSQTDCTLNLRIRAPHSRPKDIQLSVDGHDFRFYTSPYILHLRFEHCIYLDEEAPISTHTVYDFETGVATITLQKLPPYPHFGRLDMLSTLLVTRPSNGLPPSIEVLSSNQEAPSERKIQHLEDKNDTGLLLPLRELSITRPKYGFGMRYEGVFAVRAEDVGEILEVPDPDQTPVWKRGMLRRKELEDKFDDQHYMVDWLLDEEFEHVLQYMYKPPDVEVRMRDEWLEMLVNLPSREYLKEVDARACADLAGLLYASCYDNRVTMGERCVESAWTVSRICATMSWLEGFHAVREAVLAAFRGVLVYPLYRHFGLAEFALADLKQLMSADVEVLRARLLRVLLDLRVIFESDSLLRLFCDLLLIDYCVWVQKVGDDVLERFRDDVLELNIGRQDMGWNLDSLEQRAIRIANGEEEGNEPENDVGEPEEVDDGTRMLEETGISSRGEGEITISALSAYPKDGAELTPVETRSLTPEDSAKRKRSDKPETNGERQNNKMNNGSTEKENNTNDLPGIGREIAISALGSCRAHEWNMTPVETRKLTPDADTKRKRV